jgi:G3E family GTPase
MRATRIPVWLVTGFLGAGKTTFVGNLATRPDFKKALFVINEWSALGIDQLLIPTESEQIRLLENGCLCCAWAGEMGDTLRNIVAERDAGKIPAFDRIVIETTGLADPVPIIRTLVGDPGIAPLLELESVICVIDAVHGSDLLRDQREATKQLAIADTVLVSKSDLAGREVTARVLEEARRINPIARVQRVQHGDVDLDALARGAGTRNTIGLPQFRSARTELDLSGDAGGSSASARHDASIKSFTIVRDDPMSMETLEDWLALLLKLRGARLLRVKGLVNVEGEPVAIHAVQTILHEPVTLARWPSADRRTRLVFIGRGLDESAIEGSLSAAQSGAKARTPGPIDAAAYRAFLETAAHLV